MDDLEREQVDFTALLDSDPLFNFVKVLREEKGDIEATINQSLSTLNAKNGKGGVVVVVLQPDELPSNPDTPNPELRIRISVQVIETILFNRAATGTGQDVFSISRRVRQLGHRRSFGYGDLAWVGTETVAQSDSSKRSRMVTFTRLAQEQTETRLGRPLIEPEEGGEVGDEVTITPPGGAAAYYTIDGSLPVPGAAGTTLYAGPITIAAACLLRAVSVQEGLAPSSVSQARFQ